MAHGLLFVLLFSSLISINIHACNPRERSSLLSFVLVDPSSPPLNWTSSNCCHWEGIICNQDGSVTHVSLPSKGLKLKRGIFPLSSLANLTHLTHLNLSHNSISGSFVQTGFFLSLSRLEVLDLSYNLLFGELPSSSPLSSNIRMVDLSSNHFHGAIPSSFFQQARNLTSFSISNNTFSGSIPSAICFRYSPFIRLLDFSSNNFNGSIPSGLGKCSKLKVFRAGYNNLSGLLREDIYDATTLEEIALPFNSLYGAFSDRIGNLTNLTILDFSSNQLRGVLPLHFGKLAKLKLMLLDSNNLEGTLPQTLMNCTNLVELRMGDNNLEGDISAFDFSKLSQLGKIDLRKNNFTGTLPISLYSCKSLKAIRLSSNNLEGQLQPEILSLKSLSFLSLSSNRLTNITRAMEVLSGCTSLTTLILSNTFVAEEIPATDGVVGFDGFQNLRMLILGGCEITGHIPVWLSNLKRLEILDLSYNRLTGTVPSWLGTLPRLFHINLGFNQISGQFPKELCRLPMLVSEKTAAQDAYGRDSYLELPIFVTTAVDAKSLQYNYLLYFPPSIFLYNNQLNGSIPTEIGHLQLLRALNLRNNNFSGNIPDQISDLKNLDALNLAMNHLSGKFPSSLARLNFLALFNVSYNNLEGAIPTSTQLQSFSSSAFEGNPKLCGAPLPNKCRPTKGIVADDKKSQEVDSEDQVPWFHISVALGFIVGFWGVCGPLVFKNKWRYAYFQFLENVQDSIKVCIQEYFDVCYSSPK